MDRSEILARVKSYLVDEVLEGNAVGLTEETNLLESGILNSMEVLKLSAHIKKIFDIEVPPRQMVAENLKNLESITGLVMDLGGWRPHSQEKRTRAE